MEVTKSKEPTQGAKEERKPELDSAIIDELMKDYQRPGPGGILEQLTKRVYERILGAEMTHYLGYIYDAKGNDRFVPIFLGDDCVPRPCAATAPPTRFSERHFAFN